MVSAGICGEDEVRRNSQRIYEEMIGGLLAVIFVIFAAASFPAARTEYGSCDIQREPALEITSRKNYLEGA